MFSTISSKTLSVWWMIILAANQDQVQTVRHLRIVGTAETTTRPGQGSTAPCFLYSLCLLMLLSAVRTPTAHLFAQTFAPNLPLPISNKSTKGKEKKNEMTEGRAAEIVRTLHC